MSIMQAAYPRLERRRQLFELADSQGGHFTAAQAKALGYLAQYQQHHRKSGAWISVARGLYRLRDYPPSEHAQIQELSLWSHDRSQRPQATLSHQSGLSLSSITIRLKVLGQTSFVTQEIPQEGYATLEIRVKHEQDRVKNQVELFLGLSQFVGDACR